MFCWGLIATFARDMVSHITFNDKEEAVAEELARTGTWIGHFTGY